MKRLILVICLAELMFVTSGIFIEKISPYLPFARMQRPKSRNLISYQQARQDEKIKRILHVIDFIDQNCLKKFHKEFRYYRTPFGRFRYLQMPAFRNYGGTQLDQILYNNNMRQNQFKKSQNRRYFGNDRTIFLHPYAKLTGKRVNAFLSRQKVFSQNETNLSQSFTSFPSEKPKFLEEMQKNFSINEPLHQKKQNRKYTAMFPLDGETPKSEKQLVIENSTVLIEVQKIQKISGSRKNQSSRFPYKFSNITSTTATYFEIPSRYFWPQERLTETQPYEVEEIIEEELSLDVNDEKNDNLKNIPFGRPKSLGKDIKKIKNSENGSKILNFHGNIGSSINTVLKTLMAPMTIKKQFQSRPALSNYFTSTPLRLKTFPDRQFKSFNRTTKKTSNRQEQSKLLKLPDALINEKFFNWTQKSTEPAVKSELSRFHLKPTWSPEYRKYDHTANTTDISYIRTDDPIKKKDSDLTQNPKHSTTVMSETEISVFSSEPNLSNQSSLTTVETPWSQKDFSTQETWHSPLKYSESSSEIPTTLTEASTNVNELTTSKLTTTDWFEKSTEIFTKMTGLTAKQNTKTEGFSSIINESELSNSNFQEFTDHFLTNNFLTTLKPDVKKNSRKMHFGQEVSETTFNQISELESTGPRRSDILITENIDDYVDVDNNLSTLNYLNKLKQSNSFSLLNFSIDSTSETIIPLIPTIITDLREGKISPEDISILSEAFSKYWSVITTLSNITNLDMLPLLKMKNEEDLKNVLEIILPENTEKTTIKMTENYPSTSQDNEYDYIDEYIDFYQYILGSEQEEKERKRKKLRSKRDNEDDLKKVKTTRDYFEKTEEEQHLGNNNLYVDDIVYNETSKEKEFFEPRFKMADIDTDIHNVTLFTTHIAKAKLKMNQKRKEK